MKFLKAISYIAVFFPLWLILGTIMGASAPNNNSAAAISFFLSIVLLIVFHLMRKAVRSKSEKIAEQQAINTYNAEYQQNLRNFRERGLMPIDISSIIYMPKEEKVYCAVYASQNGYVRTGHYTNSAFQFTVPITKNLRYRQSAGSFQPEAVKTQIAQGILIFADKYVYFKTKDGSSHRWSWKSGIGDIDTQSNKITIYPTAGKAAEFDVSATAEDLAIIDCLKMQQSGADRFESAQTAAENLPQHLSVNEQKEIGK